MDYTTTMEAEVTQMQAKKREIIHTVIQEQILITMSALGQMLANAQQTIYIVLLEYLEIK